MRDQDDNLRQLVAEQAAAWHAEHLEWGLDPQQARAFMRWLRTSPMHVAEYLIVTRMADDLAEAAQASTTPVEVVLANESGSVHTLPLHAMKPAHSTDLSPRHGRGTWVRRRMRACLLRRRSRVRWAAMGVVATALVLSVSLAGWHWLAPSHPVHTYVTQRGEVRSVQLPDDTVVKLDAESAITVHFDGRHRRVTLRRGQAYFDVAKDSERPFSVQVGPSLIRDIGTAFDVYRHKTGSIVAVAHGRVQVWHAPHTASRSASWLPWAGRSARPPGRLMTTLDGGQEAKIAHSGQVASQGTFDVQQMFAWMHGRIAFDNRRVASVAAEFNRYNNVQIRVEDRRVGELRISGMFNARSVSAFTAFLGSLPGVGAEKHGQIVIIHADSIHPGTTGSL
jgi:transmembrane sensor